MFPKKYLLIILVLYFLAVFQKSFLVHFDIFGGTLNLVLILVFLINFFGSTKKSFGIFTGVLGGFILDLSSVFPFGTFILTLGVLSFLIQKSGSLFQRSNIFTFSAIFLLSFFFYKLFSSFLAAGMNFLLQIGTGAVGAQRVSLFAGFNFGPFLSGFFYNLFFVLLGFFFMKRYSRSGKF